MNWPDLWGLLILLTVAAALIWVIGSAALLIHLLRPRRKTYAVALARELAVEPAEMGLDAQAVTFALSDGEQSPGWIIQGQRPDGPRVVVVHGFGDSRFGALTWTPLLLPHASAVVVYDLRGHGESSAKNAHCGTTDVVDLLGILDQLPEPSPPVVLFGYSMGAGIAIAAAARSPERVAGVIADGPYRFWDEPIKHYLRLRRYPAQPFVWLAGLMLRATVRDFAGFDRAAHAARLRCPLLVLHGRDDPICPLASARAIADDAPDGDLIIFDDAGHLDLAAVDEPRYRRVLVKFFRSVQ